ncbi:hypothetical protein HY771_03950 [Candidatus Uhrbacteria bacterium]|nr:hypothetical protein [Candidatus Uhrbacteria bacterium]
MAQTARISIITLLTAILVAMFGNGMFVIHSANAGEMNHESSMETSQNAMCSGKGCMQEHGTCETHCVSTPIENTQTVATVVNQNVLVSIDATNDDLAISIFEPNPKPKTQNLKPHLTLLHLQTVMKKE